jgi:hypothetical protein
MKKLICIILALSVSLAAFAELHKPNRIVEIGLDSSVGVSNNYFDVRDILVENLVFDLQKIADEMPAGGLNFNAAFDSDFFINVNAKPTFRLGFFIGFDGSGIVNVPQQLFTLLAEGNSIDDTESVKLNASAQVFADMGITYHTVYRGYGLTITPAYYLPIVSVPDAEAKVTYTTNSDGTIRANATAPVTVYSLLDMKQFVDGDSSSADIQSQISDAMKCGGFDLALAVEHPVLSTLEVGAFTRIPILPGHLNYKMTANAHAEATVNNILGTLDDTNSSDTDYDVDDPVYDTASYTIYRPFRLGVEAAWRPFGSWCTLAPAVALVVRSPYSSDAVFYPEYRLDSTFSLYNIVALKFGTAYEGQVFIQRMGFMLNARVVEFDVETSLQGTDFFNSFNYGGLGVYAGVRIGF